jgi:glycosyltransferase involved in cell wall biosynthesis
LLFRISAFCFQLSAFFVRLVIFSHKPCWRSASSPTGYATDGGFPFQMKALSELVDETRLLVPCYPRTNGTGEIGLEGRNLSVVPLSARRGSGFSSKLGFLPWLLLNCGRILRELRRADAVHAPIPGDVGTVGMLGAWLCRKPLFVRYCGNWLRPVTAAEEFWRWFMETFAGGRNVMLATGGTAEPPSQKNANVRWIFSSSLTENELSTYASPRSYPSNGDVRLVIAARQETAKGAGSVIQALPALARDFPQITFEVLGNGSALPRFKRLAADLKVEDRVTFAGQLDHDQVLERLTTATVFVFPTTSSDGFPKAVLEGLATGLPVVATRVSVLPQLLGNGSGILINEATPEAISQGVSKVLASAAAYEDMSRKAIETARQYSLESWRDTIGGYLSTAWGPLKGKDEGGKLKSEKAAVVRVETRKQKLGVTGPVVRRQ